jgi:hypothetical protein
MAPGHDPLRERLRREALVTSSPVRAIAPDEQHPRGQASPGPA